MNSLIIFPDEIENSIATIGGRHLAYVTSMHDLKVGRKIPISLWGGKRGVGTITEFTSSFIKVSFSVTEAQLPRDPTVLIVAIPRPATQKKIIHLATVLGVRELHFIRCERCEKSYLDSKVLNEEFIKYEIVKGLEQCYDSTPPLVSVHRLFKPFCEDVLNKQIEDSSARIICDTNLTDNIRALPKLSAPDQKVFIAIGPEAGWNDFERDTFNSLGFKTVSLGHRILRCETATSQVLGQIECLRNLTYSPGDGS